jgi:tRNA pseudouridine13 synthase
VSYGGLKDRHAQTIQYLTITGGPRKGLTHHDVTLEYLGQVSARYTSSDIRANRFLVTLRDLDAEEWAAAEQALQEVQHEGVPNYFDDQRFGSVDREGQFVARLIVQGQDEEALRQALAVPYQYERGSQKKEKAILRRHWGDWSTCKRQLPRGHSRSLVDYLTSHPGDFRGALERLRPELRGLYLSAYQSHLWNRMLAWWIHKCCRPEQLLRVRLRLGEMPMFRGLDQAQKADLKELWLPLPSARVTLAESDPNHQPLQAVLAEEGIQLEQLKLKGFRQMFFSRGERPALCLPENLRHESSFDEWHPKRKKLILAFDLPRGNYATLIVKRITRRHQE